jgi:hypothetical protein
LNGAEFKSCRYSFDRLRREFPRLAARKIRSALAGKSLFDAYVHLYHYAQEMVEQGKMLPNPRDKTNVSRRPESGSGPDVVILAAMEYVKNSAGSSSNDDSAQFRICADPFVQKANKMTYNLRKSDARGTMVRLYRRSILASSR